jgi:hypothetical protein
MCWRIWYPKVLSHTEEEQVSECKEEAYNMAFSAIKNNKNYYMQILFVNTAYLCVCLCTCAHIYHALQSLNNLAYIQPVLLSFINRLFIAFSAGLFTKC